MVQVTLNAIEEKQSKKGNPYWILQTDGGRFWSTTAVAASFQGKQVEIDAGGQKGDQANAVRLVHGAAASGNGGGRNESIEQQVAIKEVGEHLRLQPENIPADVTNAYWNWIRERLELMRDIEPEEE